MNVRCKHDFKPVWACFGSVRGHS